MSTVCLIIPPSGFLMDERVFMPLGILRVAQMLIDRGFMVEVLDLSGVSNFVDVVAEHAEKTEARVFGLTATSPQLPPAADIVKKLRELRPDSRIILGGPHVTLVNAAHKKGSVRVESAMKEIRDLFDVLVAGDGEEAVFLALDPKNGPLIDADDPKSRLFLTDQDFSALPFPARHLVDVGSYNYSIDGERALSLIAQLGCPFSCRFCGGRNSASFRRIRQRDVENVVLEMEHLYSVYGVKGFMLYDDELNVNKQMVFLMNRIAETQERLGVEWKLRGFVKSELFTDEQAEVMYRAGFRWILVGFESGSPKILSNIDKKAKREDNSRCVEIAHRHGLKVKALMSVGHPGESLETIKETEEWLLEARPDDFDITTITTYPGTPYYDEAVRHGDGWVYVCPKSGDKLYQVDISYTKVTNYYKGKLGDYKAYVYTDYLSSEELVMARDALEKSIREKLGIPYPRDASKIKHEHSMGQSGVLPDMILRSSE